LSERLGRHIVVGVHSSATSLAALAWAGREARLRDTGVRVVYAWENAAKHLAPYASRARLPGRERQHQAALCWLDEAVRVTLGSLPPTLVSVEVAEGLAARVLLDRAAGAEMLVLGSASGQAPGTIGPVAQACLRNSPCPVVVVTAGMTATQKAGLSAPALV
jgi:nucleotide-binding universal stress UspA family protein